jgi:phthiocerol/phenolphthiocerol synthesis type-I polyketide synthase C
VSLQSGTEQAASWITTRAIPMPRRDSHSALGLPSVIEATRLCAERLHAPQRLASRRRFTEEVEPLLDALCAAFAERALRGLAGTVAIDPQALLAGGHVSTDGRHLLQSLLQVLSEEGVIRAAGPRWEWSAGSLHFPEPEDIWRRLIADYPEYKAIIVRTGTAGLRLRERLRAGSHAEPRERHLAESAFSWADGCTREEAVAVFGALNDVVAAALAAQPREARLRVLYLIGTLPREEVASPAATS